MGGRQRTAGIIVAIAIGVAGCGADSGGRAATRPPVLLKSPPPGYVYKNPDPARVKQATTNLLKNATALKADDIAVRLILKNGHQAGVAVVADAHGQSGAEDATKGAADGFKQLGGTAGKQEQVAGTSVAVGQFNGVTIAIGPKNGYVLEAVAGDQATATTVLGRLITAAAAAKR